MDLPSLSHSWPEITHQYGAETVRWRERDDYFEIIVFCIDYMVYCELDVIMVLSSDRVFFAERVLLLRGVYLGRTI